MVTTDLTSYFKLVNNDFTNNISKMVVCDMLSVALKQGLEGDVLITTQNNCNSIAVATLMKLSCVIISSGFDVDEEMIKHANENNITIFTTDKYSVDVVLLLNKLGINNE